MCLMMSDVGVFLGVAFQQWAAMGFQLMQVDGRWRRHVSEATFRAFNLPASHHKLDHPQKANNIQ
jgi:hypothetical protein